MGGKDNSPLRKGAHSPGMAKEPYILKWRARGLFPLQLKSQAHPGCPELDLMRWKMIVFLLRSRRSKQNWAVAGGKSWDL